MNVRYYIDPTTELPHIYNQDVSESEVEDVLPGSGEDRPGEVGISPETTPEKPMTENRYPPGWDQARVEKVLSHYESQDELEAVAEDEAGLTQEGQTLIEVPNDLVSKVRELIAKYRAA